MSFQAVKLFFQGLFFINKIGAVVKEKNQNKTIKDIGTVVKEVVGDRQDRIRYFADLIKSKPHVGFYILFSIIVAWLSYVAYIKPLIQFKGRSVGVTGINIEQIENWHECIYKLMETDTPGKTILEECKRFE